MARTLAADLAEADALIEEFDAALRRDPAHAFHRYRAGGNVARYVGRLFANHCAPRILVAIRRDQARGLELFEVVFGPDVRRMATRHGNGRTERGADDVYHDVLAHLFEDDARRLLAFDGTGAFTRYLERVVRNYARDDVRRERGRRRLPVAISRLSAVEQAAYRLMAWHGLSGHEALQRLRVAEGAGESDARLEASIDRIIPFVSAPPQREADLPGGTSLPEPDPDVVSALLRWQRIRSPHSELVTRLRRRELDGALGRLRRMIADLPDEQRAFLAARYFADTPLTPRAIAEQWKCPTTHVYEVGRRAMASLRARLRDAGLEAFLLD